MSQYIQLHTSFFTHRKTMRLQLAIGQDALWVMPRLWCFALSSQPDGDFSKWTDGELALAIGYSRDAAALFSALVDAGYMDTARHLTNWQERQSYARMAHERAKKAAHAKHASDKEEKERNKESKQEPSMLEQPLSRTSSTKGRCTAEECSAYCLELGLPADDGVWFFDKAEGNGWKNGGAPIKDWKATIRAWKRAGYMASQRNGQGRGARPANWSDKEYSKAQVAKLRDDLKFAPPEKRDDIRAAIAKHEAVIGGGK